MTEDKLDELLERIAKYTAAGFFAGAIIGMVWSLLA